MFDALVAGEARLNPARSIVTLLAIALGVGLWLALATANDAVGRALRVDAALGGEPVDLRVTAPGRGVPERALAEIRALPAIRSARPVIEGNAWLSIGAGRESESVRLVGADLLQPLPAVGGFEQRDPGVFTPQSTPFDRMTAIAGGEIVLSSRVAGRLGVRDARVAARLGGRAGVSVRVSGPGGTVSAPVAYVLPPQTTGVDSSVAFVDVSTAQQVFALEGYFGRIDCDAYGAAGDARRAIAAVLPPGARVGPPVAAAGSLARLLQGRARDPGTLALVASLIALSLLYNGIGSSVASRRAEIGTLRALGASRASIFFAFVLEGALFGALGGSLGVGLAIVCVQPLAGILSQGATHVQIEWSDLRLAAVALLGGVVAATVAAVVPALRATRIAPARVTGARGFEARVPWLARVASALRKPLDGLGPLGYLTAREIAGSPRRMLIALAAFAVAVGATVEFAISDASTSAAVRAWTQSQERGDLQIRPSGFDEASGTGAFASPVPARIRALAGVARVASRRSFPIEVGGVATTLHAGTDNGLAPGEAMLTAPLAKRLHVGVGASVPLPSPTGDVDVRVVRVQSDVTDPAGSVYVDSNVAAARYRDPRSDEIDVWLRPSADAAGVRRTIVRALEPLRLDVVTARERRAQILGAFDAGFALSDALEALAIGLSIAGLAVTLAGVVLERRREYAMLRYAGASRALVFGIVRFEAFLVCAAGCALGTSAGIAVAYLVSPVDVTVPLGRIALALGATFVAVAIAAAYPARVAAAIAPDSAGTA